MELRDKVKNELFGHVTPATASRIADAILAIPEIEAGLALLDVRRTEEGWAATSNGDPLNRL